MKQLISLKGSRSVQCVLDVELSTDKYYGVFMTPTLHKGFIVQETYMSGPFHVVARSCLTRHNSFDAFVSNDLFTCIRSLLKDNNQVFMFDTPEELFEWLARK